MRAPQKWPSYRERGLLGRDLKPEEARYVTEMVRRIAAFVLMGPELDANYERVKPDVWEWGSSPHTELDVPDWHIKLVARPPPGGRTISVGRRHRLARVRFREGRSGSLFLEVVACSPEWCRLVRSNFSSTKYVDSG